MGATIGKVVVCSVAGCTRLLRARGLCSSHYQRWVRGEDPGVCPSCDGTGKRPLPKGR